MKKLVISVIAVAALLSASTTQAALIGLKPKTAGLRPKIDINTTGLITYTGAVGGGGGPPATGSAAASSQI